MLLLRAINGVKFIVIICASPTSSLLENDKKKMKPMTEFGSRGRKFVFISPGEIGACVRKDVGSGLLPVKCVRREKFFGPSGFKVCPL